MEEPVQKKVCKICWLHRLYNSWFLHLAMYKFPLPKINTCLDTLNGCQYYSSCDLRWGYWQTEIDERDRDKTAFVTRKGQWRFKVLRCNAPSQFACIMELVMSSLTYDICLVYLVDILVFSKTFKEHCDRLSIIFNRTHWNSNRPNVTSFRGRLTFLDTLSVEQA